MLGSLSRPVKSASTRVVVTGLDAVSSVGVGVADFGSGLRGGRSGARPITSYDTTGFPHNVGTEVIDFEAADFVTRSDPARLGRASGFVVAAAAMAVAGAELEVRDNGRSVICIGTTDGAARDLDHLVQHQLGTGSPPPLRDLLARVPVSNLSTAVAREVGLRRSEVMTVPTACAAGNYAIGFGLDAIRVGDADVAICGGVDAVCLKTFAGFFRLGTIAPDMCQPFDVDRKGILTGEGAGVLVLERLDHAVARGAPIVAEILGYGLNCDAYHPVAPLRGSVARCMQLALDDAGVKTGDVSFISAHGTGTRANDVMEAGAIRDVYGKRTPPTVSMKSMLGHSMGAASALAAVGCCLAIQDSFMPPTINHVSTDPECDVDCVPNIAIDMPVDVVQNNGLAFGGNNSVVVLGKFNR